MHPAEIALLMESLPPAQREVVWNFVEPDIEGDVLVERDEEHVFAGIFPSTRRRLVWLGINLVTAFLAAAVVSRFEGTIEKVAALAALMPIVAWMGSIAGTQTVTFIIRGIALGQVEWVNATAAPYRRRSLPSR